ncbi:hypothetical protein [Kineosporia sp. NBRC 101731]|uniref:hypothetical protein n=1 Tax=Kineosporia sp. NBRC 101731 TaxID=3032199 RepID=UPI0024A4214A|nr:hypothetical protein [Kineosporia sp. NBRC 101731]GLY29257.1 hypothetical protein Kisp02_26220 [Kineosporia sp. NBRC 101731]
MAGEPLNALILAVGGDAYRVQDVGTLGLAVRQGELVGAMAVFPVRSMPAITSSAVEDAVKPDPMGCWISDVVSMGFP